MTPKGSVDALVGDLIDDYDQMADEFDDRDDVEWLCRTMVEDLRRLRDKLDDGVFEAAAPGDPTVVKKPPNPTKADAIRAQMGVTLAAEATEMIYGHVVVAMADSGDLIVAVQERDVSDWLDDSSDDGDDDDYDNPRFGSPR